MTARGDGYTNCAHCAALLVYETLPMLGTVQARCPGCRTVTPIVRIYQAPAPSFARSATPRKRQWLTCEHCGDKFRGVRAKTCSTHCDRMRHKKLFDADGAKRRARNEKYRQRVLKRHGLLVRQGQEDWIRQTALARVSQSA